MHGQPQYTFNRFYFMKLSISLLVIVLGIILSSSSCKRINNELCQHPVVISNEGSVAADGCDWVLTIDGQRYHAQHLADNFKQDGLHAYCDYQLTGDTFYCGLMPLKLPVVQVTCFKFLEE